MRYNRPLFSAWPHPYYSDFETYVLVYKSEHSDNLYLGSPRKRRMDVSGFPDWNKPVYRIKVIPKEK